MQEVGFIFMDSLIQPNRYDITNTLLKLALNIIEINPDTGNIKMGLYNK